MINNTKRIAIYGQVSVEDGSPRTGGEVLSGFVLMDCKVSDRMQMMEHPVESGAKITDYEVRQPVEVNIQASLSTYNQAAAAAAYSELVQLYTDGVPLMIKTSADVYSNMLISGIPYDELPQQYDRVVFNLSFKEVVLVKDANAPLSQDDVSDPADAGTVSCGQKQARSAKSNERGGTAGTSSKSAREGFAK